MKNIDTTSHKPPIKPSKKPSKKPKKTPQKSPKKFPKNPQNPKKPHENHPKTPTPHLLGKLSDSAVQLGSLLGEVVSLHEQVVGGFEGAFSSGG